jgi:hypothetical protein
MKITCAFCGKEADKPAGEVNRARKAGRDLYCDRACAGMGRRQPPKTVNERKAEKREYDARRREELAEVIKAKKAEYYRRTHDPVREAEARKRRMPSHLAYCRTPEYREWKAAYDRQYRAKADYGEFWECHLLALDIREEALRQSSDYEIRLEKGGHGKTQQRRRDYERFRRAEFDGEEFEVGALGNLAGGEDRRHAAGTG